MPDTPTLTVEADSWDWDSLIALAMAKLDYYVAQRDASGEIRIVFKYPDTPAHLRPCNDLLPLRGDSKQIGHGERLGDPVTYWRMWLIVQPATIRYSPGQIEAVYYLHTSPDPEDSPMTEEAKPNRLGITNGVVSVSTNEDAYGVTIGVLGRRTICKVRTQGDIDPIPHAEAHANARLIADAFTTANRKQKLPSELAAENERLREALRDIRDNYDCDAHPSNRATACRCCIAAHALANREAP